MVTAWPSCRPISAMVVMGDSVVVFMNKFLGSRLPELPRLPKSPELFGLPTVIGLCVFQFWQLPNFGNFGIPLTPPPHPLLLICHTPRPSCRGRPLLHRLRSPSAGPARAAPTAATAWSAPSRCRLRPAIDGNHGHACCHGRGWNECGLSECQRP